MSTRTSSFEKQAGKIHPAAQKLTWSNTDNTFKIYDKGSKSTVLAKLPLRFMVIDNYNTITGWCEKSECSYYSNEIKNVNTDVLTVKAGPSTVIAGKYPEIKDNLAAMGAKYAESIYVMFEDGTIGNIIMQGSNCAEWFNFKATVKSNITKQWIGMGNPQKHKKGSIVWSTPEIKLLETISDADATRADAAYDAIQEYKAGVTTPSETTLGGEFGSLEDKKAFLDSVRTNPNIPESEVDDSCDIGY